MIGSFIVHQGGTPKAAVNSFSEMVVYFHSVPVRILFILLLATGLQYDDTVPTHKALKRPERYTSCSHQPFAVFRSGNGQ